MPLRILLAEDNPVNQRLAVRLLEKEGHTMKVVDTGRAAVAAWTQAQGGAPFDVVLMDVQMPDMDGLEATGAIRAQENVTGGRVPIVAMTAHAMPGDRERCLAAGMDGYLAKPLVTGDFWNVIAQVPPGRASLTGCQDVLRSVVNSSPSLAKTHLGGRRRTEHRPCQAGRISERGCRTEAIGPQDSMVMPS